MSQARPEWLQRLLSRADVTDICLNGAGGVFIDRGAGLERLETSESGDRGNWGPEAQRAWVLDELAAAGKTWDARHPFADATLAGGHRLHVAFPPIARQGLLVSIRRLPFQDPESPGGSTRWADSPLYPRLAEAIRSGDTLIVCGATGSGKTTLAGDLLAEAPPSERIIALEDTPELAPRHPHFVSLISRPPNADGFGEVTLRTLLRQTLRMRPDRIVLGECRGTEVLELLQALNTGHRGALATLHANSARDALRRLELLCLLATGGGIPPAVIRELLALGIQWIAHVRRTGAGRRIHELWKVEGREGDAILMRQVN